MIYNFLCILNYISQAFIGSRLTVQIIATSSSVVQFQWSFDVLLPLCPPIEIPTDFLPSPFLVNAATLYVSLQPLLG